MALHPFAPPVLAALLAATVPMAVRAQATTTPGGPQFQVINRTGSVATAVHAVRTGSAGWGPNLVAGTGVRPGRSVTVFALNQAGCNFDLRLVLIDRAPIERRNIDICRLNRIEFTVEGAAIPSGPGGGAQVAGKPPPGAGVGIEADPNYSGTPAPAPRGPGRPQIGAGTGFVVAEGRVLTNSHVIERCARVVARTSQGRELPAQVLTRDADLDLALLSVARDAGPPLSFRDPPTVRRGDEVVTYGFPLAGILSSGPTLTRGDISALGGMRDDQNQMQISAPVQPGNSGGPLLDRSGNVIGVVVGILVNRNPSAGDGFIPQNVNFAIKADRALGFLRRSGVAPRMAASAQDRPAAEVGEIAHPSTLFLQCYR